MHGSPTTPIDRNSDEGSSSETKTVQLEQEKLQELIHHSLRAVMTYTHLDVPEKKFPKAMVTPGTMKTHGEHEECPYFSSYSNTFVIRTTMSDKHSQIFGSILGEECVGHFLRKYHVRRMGILLEMCRRKNTYLHYKSVNEFYGYTGRQMLFKALTSHPQLQEELFPKRKICKPDPPSISLRDMQTYRAKRHELNDQWHNLPFWNFIGATRLENAKTENLLDEIDVVAHARGYQFANLLDINQLSDWNAFFSLSLKEVRSRFFRIDQNYEGL